MLASFVIGTLALAPSAIDKWEIKPPYQKDKTYKMNVSIEVDAQGEHVSVTLAASLKFTQQDDKGFNANLTWSDIMVNGAPAGMDMDAQCSLDKRGKLLKADSQLGEEFRRQMLPMFFIYPEKPIDAGDKWSDETTKNPDGTKYQIKQEFEAKGIEKAEGEDAMKVAVKFTETGENAMQVSGFYWIAKDGRPLKLDLDVKNWPIPQQGAGASGDVKIKGTLAK